MPTQHTGSHTVDRDKPQVGGNTHTISLLTSEVDRAVRADVAPNRRARRSKSTTADVPTVVAVHFRSRSKRGLDWHQYSARCPGCGERRIFTRSGLRRCACGTALNVTVGAEVA